MFVLRQTRNILTFSEARVTISGMLDIPLVDPTGCEIRLVFWLLWTSGRVEPYSLSQLE